MNQFRDRSNDTLDLGRIDFSIYNQSLMLTVENQSPSVIKYMPVCPYNYSYDSYLKRCYICPNQEYSTSFNSKSCTICYYPQGSSTFEQLLKLIYCKIEGLFDPSWHTYQSKTIILPFQAEAPPTLDESLNPTVDIAQNESDWSNSSSESNRTTNPYYDTFTTTLIPCLINGYDCKEALRKFNPQPLPGKVIYL